MVGIYFSGTGNTKHCVEKFMHHYDVNAKAFSIEDSQALLEIREQSDVVLGYPVQYSNIPKILRDYIISHQDIWKGRRIFIIATMGLFSGDGAGILARLLQKYGAEIIGGLHLKMPDSIGDEKALKRPLAKNKELVSMAEEKIATAASQLQNGNPSQEGLGIWYRLAGLFGQRLYFYNKTKRYTDKLKIDSKRCIGCGMCVSLCPMENIIMKEGTAQSKERCTMCYRCVNHCSEQAITLLGRQVVEQSRIERYL